MKKILPLIFFYFFISNLKSQNIEDDLWTKSTNLKSVSIDVLKRESKPSKFELYHLNLLLLKEKLKNAPNRGESFSKSNVIISFPNNEGILENFEVMEASVMEPELQKKYPEIRSYIGKGIDHPNSIIRLTVTPLGLDCMQLSNSDSPVLIDPYTKDRLNYMVYSKKDLPILGTFLENDIIDSGIKEKSASLVSNGNVGFIDGNLRTFRLALSTTAENSQEILTKNGIPESASDEHKTTIVLSDLNLLMTKVNAVFERDFCVTLRLVSNETSLIFLDPNTDGFTDFDAVKLIFENKNICDNLIGGDNYDIGHVISKNTNVNTVSLASICTNNKAIGVSCGAAQEFVLLHEMAHQLGAGHTFNSCGMDHGYSSEGSAVEAGCGLSLMSYGGNSDNEYYHSASVEQILNNITTGTGQCAVLTPTGNIAPIADAGYDLTIPKSTPFILEGKAADDVGNLTYNWDQMDQEQNEYPPVSTAVVGPISKWNKPSLSPIKYMPELSLTLAGKTISESEALPSVSRILNFNFVVWDNDFRGGQVAIDKKVIQVDGNSGPFIVTSQKSSEIWDAGTIKTITWDVSGTNGGAINTQFVDILFSTDGGYTYPTKLASNVPNDGSQDIVVPFGIKTTTGRYMVRAVENIFFAINRASLTVVESPFLMNFINDTIDVCLPTSSASFDFMYNAYNGYNDLTLFSADSPDGTSLTFTPTSATLDSTSVKINITGITSSNIGKNSIEVIGTSNLEAEQTKTKNIVLSVYGSVNSPVALLSPANDAIDVLPPYTLTWKVDNNAKTYTVEIALDNAFSNIIETGTTSKNYYDPSLLKINTTYFWRVKSKNPYSNESISVVKNFKTVSLRLLTYVPDGNFQQALIDLGYDNGSIKNYVLTSNISAIETLTVVNKKIYDLTGIEGFSSLKTLYCYQDELTSLDVSNNTALTLLFCSNNKLSSLDVSKNVNLTNLYCGGNLFTSIDISSNINLTWFECPVSKLTNLDLSKNTNIITLYIWDSKITSIDLTNNLKLKFLNCELNELKNLDLSKNTDLVYLRCLNNKLTYLNIKNGNNGKLTDINVASNPQLKCIQVDNVLQSLSYSNWFKDNTATYSEDCVPFVVPTITSFSPTKTCTGETITINGTNLLGATAVSLGGIPAASFTVISDTSITAVVGESSSGNVSVITSGGTAMLPGFDYNSLPASAGTITGSATVTQRQNSVFYEVPAIEGADSYIWTLPSGATGISTTNSISVSYGNDATSGDIKVKGHNNCGDGLESSLAISVGIIQAQDIALNLGWNIISANVIPANLDLKTIFQPLIDAGKLKKVMDEAGKTIENFGAFGGWKNNIGSMASSEGYKVNVTAVSTLSLEGTPVQLPFDIALSTGWNIISYPSTSIQDCKAVVQSLIDDGKLKKVMDEAGKTIENLGAFGGWKNNIGNFLPGKGYKINVIGSCTLTITANATKVAAIVPELLASSHFTPAFKGNGLDHNNINLINLQTSGLQTEDQIGVFDDDLCVGSATLGVEQLAAGTINIPASVNDELGETLNGFTERHLIKLVLFRKGQTFPLKLETAQGNPYFEKNGSLFAKVSLTDLTGIQITEITDQFKCYPNPFSDEITIEIQTAGQSKVTVEIYNMAGQLIKNVFKGSNDAKLDLKWNGTNDSGQSVAPGVYLCKVNGQSKQVVFEGKKENR